MAITKTPVTIFTSANVAPGGTKASPVAAGIGTWVPVGSYNGGLLGGRVKNGSSAPAVAGQLTWQWSPDATSGTPAVYDLGTIYGSTTANDDVTGSIRLDKEIGYVRALCYGNTTTSVTFESHLAAGS